MNMKQLISEEFIDFKLLTPKQKEKIEHTRMTREEMFNNSLMFKQNEMLSREDDLMDRMAKAAGFDGYETGKSNYLDVYEKIMKDPLSVYGEEREKYHKFELSRWEGPFSDEYMALKDDAKEVQDYEKFQKVWLKQQYLNDVLTAIRPQAEKYKHDSGVAFLSTREYNKLPQEQKDILREPVSAGVELDGCVIILDESIADKVKRLWKMGVVTGASCSGLVQDHPYHRHQENDRFGRWKKGELEFVKADTPYAYITFPIEENHPQMIEKTRQMAGEWGWIVERQDIYGKDSVVLRPPHTLDGTSHTQIMKEIEDEIENLCALYGKTDMDEIRNEARKIVEYNHGGQVMYTDRLLAYNWREMFEGIGDIMYQIQRDTLKKNIEEGKAVKIYEYDSCDYALDANVLADVFRRSGITLDKDSVTEKIVNHRSSAHSPYAFIVNDNRARLLQDGEPYPTRDMIESTHRLSYLMAQQVKGTIQTAEPKLFQYTVKTMVHPDPQTAEQVERFTLTKEIDSHEYYASASENYDLSLMVANKFKDDLYSAAIDAYEHGFQRKVDEVTPLQTVSNIRIRKGIDGNTYISCHINGEKQLAKRMKPGDAEYYQMRMNQSDKAFNGVAPELTKKYFAREIEDSKANQEVGKGVKL